MEEVVDIREKIRYNKYSKMLTNIDELYLELSRFFISSHSILASTQILREKKREKLN